MICHQCLSGSPGGVGTRGTQGTYSLRQACQDAAAVKHGHSTHPDKTARRFEVAFPGVQA